MIVEIPLTNFVGTGGKELIERLYAVPDQTVTEKKDDYEIIQNLPTVENYKPTREHKPSIIWDKTLEGIFGTDCICIYDSYYLLYLQLVKHISEKFDCDGEFKYCYQSKDDDELIGCCELNTKEDITEFLTHIIQTVPCSLYDVELNLGIKPNSTFSV
jgi:hypothetical protein